MFLKIILFLISILTSNFLNSQSLELKKEFTITKKLYKENRFNDALKSNEKAIILSHKEFGKEHLTTATLLENKGRLLLELNKFNKAETVFRSFRSD